MMCCLIPGPPFFFPINHFSSSRKKNPKRGLEFLDSVLYPPDPACTTHIYTRAWLFSRRRRTK